MCALKETQYKPVLLLLQLFLETVYQVVGERRLQVELEEVLLLGGAEMVLSIVSGEVGDKPVYASTMYLQTSAHYKLSHSAG